MGSFRENLRDILDFQGLTVKELSYRTGLVKGTIDSYLGIRESIPPADVAVKIAQELGVTVEYLVTGVAADTKTKYTMIQDILDDMLTLDEQYLDIIRPMIRAAAITAKKKRNLAVSR
ncbi:helix-turn-helix domain-containing protein [Treponema brennaborense]|uniref:Helix-turn-helix domain protein n=1 Tax=Treponema brennaborense (strain DSM 12168 / CIP 105900 / DD5/3) TaxID=906968 RepID=F4LIR8_TREBD|nr:helix-turn-helix transcriptional regulator [Treponema brennaborense]AEE16243.1 helix-turn-helix domain protein [Treponema brennaborense DSM 12168]